MFRKLLVGVDGGHGGRDAIALGRQLAAPGADITLAHIYGPDLVIGAGSRPPFLVGRAQAEMMLERERDVASLDAQLIVFSERRAGRGLHVLAERLGADLLVVGSTAHGLFDRVLMGEDTRAALAGAPCAVAIAPRGYRHQPHELETLGVGYDGSPESDLALAAARDLAAQHGATIWALQVVSLADAEDENAPTGHWTNAPSRLIRRTITRLSGLGDGVEADAVYGKPRDELVRYGENLDLLLVGSRGYGPLGRLFHGSVSDYLARHAPCPLVILPRGLAEAKRADLVRRTEEAAMRATVSPA
jgi:nucleotide-binding universal stress UspA family protein